MNITKRSFYVLCVDDEKDILSIWGEAVQSQGLTPLLAASGSEALQLLTKHQQDIVLVLSDYQMPDMHGLELRAQMLVDYKHIPFVIISGHISREDALKAVELKISGFAAKPFSAEFLCNFIKEHSSERLSNLKDEAELIQGFIADAENLIEELESLLLALESNPSDIETVNRIFAIAHTIKGASGFFQPKTIHRFTHAFEDFLSPYKKNAMAVPPEAISVLLKGVDVIKSLLGPLQTGQPAPIPLEELLKIFQLSATKSAEKDGAKPSAEAKTAQPPSPRDEIKVPIAVLDEFMELSGEITVIRNMINKLVRAVEKEIPGNRNVNLLSELLDEMHKINSQMQDKIVDLRKFSFKNIFRPLKRAVRDLAGTLKKEVNFQTQGEELRVDTSIAEILGNSLIHMVRNCVDHGIETPETRKNNGKDGTGNISIEAKEQNQEVLVIIRDDGKGIDPELIRRKVVEKNLYSTEAASKLSVKELQHMIFESGFSTAAQVTDVSGRGVGMDMVKKAVTGGGGQVDISSTPGKGCTIQLTIPVPKMVTIINSLLVRGGSHLLAIPQENLVRLLSTTKDSPLIRRMQGTDLLHLEHELVPILNLEAVLAEKTENFFSVPSDKEEFCFVLVNCEGGLFALFVEEIYDAEDTVVKKLGRHLHDIPLYRGATFLGDGKVGLILDVPGIARHTKVLSNATAATKEAASNTQTTIKNSKSLLIVKLQKSGLFGIFLDDIFRLENILSTEMQQSGSVQVMIYRGETCPYFSADQLLQYEHAPTNTGSHNLPTLILARNNRYMGIGVEKIVDLVSTEASLDTELSDRKGIAGALIHQQNTVTILNADDLFQMAQDITSAGVESTTAAA